MPRSLLWPDPRVKPPFGAAEIDWGHPLTNGLVIYIPFNEGGGVVAQNLVGGPPLSNNTLGKMWRTARDGIGVGGASGAGNVAIPVDPIGGLASFAAYSWFDHGGSLNVTALLGIGRWNDGLGVPDTFLNRYGGGDLQRTILAFSGGNIDSTITAGWVSGARNSLCQNVTAASLTTYTNGIARGTVASTGTMTAASSGYNVFFGTAGSHATMGPYPSAGLAAALWTRPLAVGEILWLDKEPYAMLRPIVRRRYFVFHKVGPLIHATNPQLITAGGSLGGATL